MLVKLEKKDCYNVSVAKTHFMLPFQYSHYNSGINYVEVAGGGGGGYKTGGEGGGGGGVSEFLRKGGGAEQVLAMLKGAGGTTCFEVVSTWELEVITQMILFSCM